MTKKIFNLSVLSVSIFLLCACGKENMNYTTNFPSDSPEMQEFIKQYVTSDLAYPLFTEEHVYVYMKKNQGSQQKTAEYVQFSDDQLKEFYEPIFNLDKDVSDLRETSDSLFQPIENPEEYQLPQITLHKENTLNIKTALNEKEIKLPDFLSDYEVDKNDTIIFNVVAINEDGFQIDLLIEEGKNYSYSSVSIFMSKDLKNAMATKTNTNNFLTDITNNHLMLYSNLLVSLDLENRYIKANDSFSIADTANNELREIDESDLPSKNYQYIYLNGNERKLSEGMQHIQKTEDYLAGNEDYITEFELNFKDISDKLEFGSVNDISVGKVKYFSEDFVVLFLEFKAPITGTAGSTNVIIDFQEDKDNPIYYLVDLGIH